MAAAITDANGGARPVTVATLIDQGTDFVTGFLGALRAGAMVVPLDPADHEAALGDIIRHAETAVVLAHGETVAAARRLAGDRPVVNLDACQEDPAWSDLRDPRRELAGLAEGGVEVVLLPGDEHAMLTAPVAKELVAILREQTSRGRTEGQSPGGTGTPETPVAQP